MSDVKPISVIDSVQIAEIVSTTVDAGYIFVGLEAASQQDLTDALGTVNGGLGAKVDKVQISTASPFISIDPGFGQHAYFQFFTGGGGTGVRVYSHQDNIHLRAGYAIIFDSFVCNFPQGINWDMGGQSVRLSTINEFTLVTGVTNVTILNCGLNLDTVLRAFDATKHTVVVGVDGMSVPIFEVRRVSGTVTTTVMQINDVPRPSASSITTLAQLLSALVNVGYLAP